MDWSPPQLPVVLLDVDGVILDYSAMYLKYANEILDRSYTKLDITEHDIEDSLGLTREESSEIRAELDRMRAGRTMAPLRGAIEGVKSLSKSATIFFVTSSLTSSQTWEWDRRAWLDEAFGKGWGKKCQFVKD